MSKQIVSNALSAYRKRVFNLGILLLPFICLFNSIIYLILEVYDKLPDVKFSSLIVLVVIDLVLFILGVILSRKTNKNKDKNFDKYYSLGKIFVLATALIQYNYVLNILVIKDYWIYALLFFSASVFFFDMKMELTAIGTILLSTLVGCFIHHDILLPERNEYFVANLSSRILCLFLGSLLIIILNYLVHKYLITLWSKEYHDETDMLSNKLKGSEDIRKKAENINNSNSTFIKQMAHEIKTPINVILGVSQMLEKDTYDGTINISNALDYSKHISSAASSLLSLIDSLSNISKLQSGNITILNDSYPTRLVIKDVINNLSSQAQSKNLKVITNIDEKIPRGLIGDSKLIKDILNNLISNAVKYTKEGYVKLSISLVSSNNDYAKIKFSISDTGIGIKENILKKIYESFSSLDNLSEYNFEGTGLGIIISQSYLKLLGSTLNIESTYGKGSTFSFIIEQKVIDENRIGLVKKNNENNSNTQKFSVHDAKILLVDDNEMNLMIEKGLIKHLGINIELAESGKDAIKKCKNQNFDIIYIDHLMPEMNGIDASKEIRKISSYYEKTPIIALSADNSDGIKNTFISNGLNDYLEKPISRIDLEESIKKWLPNYKITLIGDNNSNDNNDNDNNDNINDNSINSIDSNNNDNSSNDNSNFNNDMFDSLVPDIDDLDKDSVIESYKNENEYKHALIDFNERIDEYLILIQNAVISLDNDELVNELNGLSVELNKIGGDIISGNCDYLVHNHSNLTSYELKMKASEIIERVLKLKNNITKALTYTSNVSYATEEDLQKLNITMDELKDKLNTALSFCENNNNEDLINIINHLNSLNIDRKDRYIDELYKASSVNDMNACKEIIQSWITELN